MAWFKALASGMLSGGTQGAIGVGGSILMVTSLTRFGGLTQAQAAGTSLPTQIFANIASGLTFASAGLVDPLAATTLGIRVSEPYAEIPLTHSQVFFRPLEPGMELG
mmetsp:Transcript_5487/g.6275  ORF Transcript_5487/g.6275 Transcript_5487/m.6275 type:complete len:107 (-) Transcript_5487:304-624(-)